MADLGLLVTNRMSTAPIFIFLPFLVVGVAPA